MVLVGATDNIKPCLLMRRSRAATPRGTAADTSVYFDDCARIRPDHPWRRRVMPWLRRSRSAVALVLVMAGMSRADEFVTLTVEPAEIVLHAASRRQQLLITARRSDGKF